MKDELKCRMLNVECRIKSAECKRRIMEENTNQTACGFAIPIFRTPTFGLLIPDPFHETHQLACK